MANLVDICKGNPSASASQATAHTFILHFGHVTRQSFHCDKSIPAICSPKPTVRPGLLKAACCSPRASQVLECTLQPSLRVTR